MTISMRHATCATLAGWILLLTAGDGRAATLNEQFQKNAHQIIKYLNQNGYQNVGILKFRIKKGRQPTGDSVGTLNKLAADRLEVALVLANPNDKGRQVAIIRDASGVAETIAGANHLSADGRRRLFGGKYALAWGDRKVTPDALLTGIIVVDELLQTMRVGILVFEPDGGELRRVVPVFEARVDAAVLGEMGESFLVRGAFDQGTTQETTGERQEKREKEAIEQAVNVKTQKASFPLAAPAAPVKLEIHYDDQLVPVEHTDGEALVVEPEENQKVHFVLRRVDRSQRRYAVVLKVNGENTLYRQTMRDSDCSKWVLSPGAQPVIIRGFQKSADKAETFRVLSRAESKKNEMYYGSHVGQIGMTVYQELPPDDTPPPEVLDEDAEDLLAMARGVFPKQPPANLFALKHRLRIGARERDTTRGLIVEGSETERKIRLVKFNVDPTPVMSVTITYYKP